MYEIDNQKFGAFVAMLRKEKGYTQKELAERLFLSDKAVSKEIKWQNLKKHGTMNAEINK